MLMPLDRAIRRARSSLPEVECFNYDGTCVKGGLQYHSRPEALYVADRETGGECNPRGGNKIVDMVTELEKMSVMRRVCPSVSPLDPITRYVRIETKRFPLYLCGGDTVASPASMSDVVGLTKTLGKAVSDLHEAGYVLWNLCPRSIYYSGKQVKLGPATLISMRKQSFADFTGSVILGSTIVSPIQVLIDMMASRFEQDTIPYADFKAKMTAFWSRVLPPDFRHVPDVVSCYHTMKDGSTEYLDHLICRWLTVKTEKKNRVVVKDAAGLLKPAILRCVDWFALAVTLDGYVEALLEKEAPPKALTDAIHTMMVHMEAPDSL